MSHFMLHDAVGSAVAAAVFAGVLYTPGFVVGYATDLFGFRRMGAAHRSAWAVALSFGVMPFASYLVAKYAGLNAACGLAVVSLVAFVVLAYRARGLALWSRRERLAVVAGMVWAACVFLSLADIQVGHKLYFSVVEFDQSYRVAFTDAVLRSGVPPSNPLYFPGYAQPMRYYYLWYVLCAMVARIGHVSARQAFIASSVWAGLGLASMVALYVRHFFGVVGEARRQTVITVSLLAVTGADLLPAIGSLFAQPALNGEMEWWSVDQFASWQDSLLWVPHHLASLLGCMLSFLLLWMAREERRGRTRWFAIFLAGLSFAGAFGLSIYIAFGFAILMIAWFIRDLFGRANDRKVPVNIVLTAITASILLAPFLWELASIPSRTDSGASAHATHIFSFSVRRMIDPELVTALPLFAAWKNAHPVLLDTAIRLFLLLPGLALELGFYGAVLVMWLRTRVSSDEKAGGPSRRLALILTVVGLGMVLFVRSAVIGNNDFGYRAALLPQFFLLLLAGDLLAGWWTPGRIGLVGLTPWRKRWLSALFVLGAAGTVYQGAMLRVFLPLEARDARSGFGGLPAKVFEARSALEELQRVSAPSAVVEFNPVDPYPELRGDVVSPYTFYARSLMMNSGRQILSGEAGCAAEFGGNSAPCAELEQGTAQLYALPSPTAQWAEEYCRRWGAQYLIAGEMDPAWATKDGWAWTLPAVVVEPAIHIVRCAP